MLMFCLFRDSVAAQGVNETDEIDFENLDAPELEPFAPASLRQYWYHMVERAAKKGKQEEFHGRLILTLCYYDAAARLTTVVMVWRSCAVVAARGAQVRAVRQGAGGQAGPAQAHVPHCARDCPVCGAD